MATAGRAVLFAGCTVVISLLGMLTMGLGYLHGVAASAVLAVLVMLSASLTLLPAVLGFVGTNIDRLRVPFTGRPSHQGERAFWYRWSRVIQHRPWLAFIGSAAVLLLITAPLFSLRLGFPDDGNSAKSETSRKAYDLLTEGFGPGFNGPLVLVVDLKGGSDTNGTLTKLSEDVKGTDGVAFVAPPVMNPAGDTAVIYAFPKNKPQDEATSKLVSRLRNTVLPATLSGTGTKVLVGGFTAIAIDQSNYIGHRLPFFIGAVVLLSFLLLTMVFRSPLVALKAGIMNLLSIAAAYGIMSFAVSGSWLGNLLNIPETPVPAFVPMITFAILFGLSMDYEVFLLSRIRKEYLRSGTMGWRSPTAWPPRRVPSRPPRPMVFVFGVFIFDPNTFVKQIGLGLTAAVLVDATIVRMVLVPATMELLGNANWWMPRSARAAPARDSHRQRGCGRSRARRTAGSGEGQRLSNRQLSADHVAMADIDHGDVRRVGGDLARHSLNRRIEDHLLDAPVQVPHRADRDRRRVHDGLLRTKVQRAGWEHVRRESLGMRSLHGEFVTCSNPFAPAIELPGHFPIAASGVRPR